MIHLVLLGYDVAKLFILFCTCLCAAFHYYLLSTHARLTPCDKPLEMIHFELDVDDANLG